ncbi:MAG: PDZ domain-containing protein [Methylococcales bacterium]|jgi:pro-apoptotic serine protease NMA111|nr:PDZ domain-containing protein [Methylococcales bacterium]MBT7410049.1 PDZ domain-containing protein [Methylococcales bacterium]
MLKKIILFFIIIYSQAIFAEWSDVIKTVSSGIVSLKINAVRAFDTKTNSSTIATGFVVDAEHGIILTNRHVLQPGPVTAEALFSNHEKVTLKALYYDPIHDFGFFQYDPKALKYIKPTALNLRPDKAKNHIGKAIRIIGNDAGEQLSILSGTLAKIDRNAPYYGYGRYNDFNTFYLQSASGVSGGSSGSPVVDSDGDVIALNAGHNRKSASSYFLPLDRVVSALKHLQQGQQIPRGTLLATLVYKSYHELLQLGLTPELEKQLRQSDEGIGALVIYHILPQSQGYNKLKPGDIILKINNQWVTQFNKLEALLDKSVDQTISIEIIRSKKRHQYSIKVENLHGYTPKSYLTISNAIIHDLSYQLVRHLPTIPEGVYLANSGYMFAAANIAKGTIISQINETKIKNLEDFNQAINKIADGDSFTLRFAAYTEPNRQQIGTVKMDRLWFKAEICKRNNKTGHWPCKKLMAGQQQALKTNREKLFPGKYESTLTDQHSKSLVHVKFNMPYPIDGIEDLNYVGSGLIVDKEKGLILTDKNTVPVPMGDIKLTFFGTTEIPAKVIFSHPTHNLSILQYNTKLIPKHQLRSATLKLTKPHVNDQLWLTGFKQNQTLFSQKVTVESISPLSLPLPSRPVFREKNLETINLANPPSSYGGVISDITGNIVAFWASFGYQENSKAYQVEAGYPANFINKLLQQWKTRQKIQTHRLDIELKTIPFSTARKMGLPYRWMKKLIAFGQNQKRQVLMISRKAAYSKTSQPFNNGDLILAINNQPVHQFSAVESLSAHRKITITILRNKKIIKLKIKPKWSDGMGTRQIVNWSGMVIQTPFPALTFQRKIPDTGVYISHINQGSPASQAKLVSVRLITEIDDTPISGLKQFIEFIQQKKNQSSVKLTTKDKLGRIRVSTLQTDTNYWPTSQVKWTDGEWVYEEIK